MLKSNCKKAKENIRNYVMNNFGGENYNIATPDNFHDAAKIIYDIFCDEYDAYINPMRRSLQELFVQYCSGLPSILNCSFFYNISAVDVLGEILEESEQEKSKYSEEQAETMLAKLIFREIYKEATK